MIFAVCRKSEKIDVAWSFGKELIESTK